MNTYKKYCPNVYVAECNEPHTKGEIIQVETKYGKENDCIVFNLVARRGDLFYYSIVRADGFNAQEFARKKAERYSQWANASEEKSTKAYEASHEGRDFLVLAEPIKVGHHSERGHRALIERNWNRMAKSVEFSEKAEQHVSKAEYWNSRTNIINLSMPESIEFFEYKVEETKEKHEGLKSGRYPIEHSFSLTYAKKASNEAIKNLELAKKLWA